jgi:hypothetical protein
MSWLVPPEIVAHSTPILLDHTETIRSGEGGIEARQNLVTADRLKHRHEWSDVPLFHLHEHSQGRKRDAASVRIKRA